MRVGKKSSVELSITWEGVLDDMRQAGLAMSHLRIERGICAATFVVVKVDIMADMALAGLQ